MRLMKSKAENGNMNVAIEKARYVVIDTELTGLNEKKDSIVSIGAVRMEGGRIEMGDSFYRLVNPGSDLTAASVVIHEIMPSEVRTEPEISGVLEQFREFCGHDVIVGYCVSIDMDFLNSESRRLFRRPFENQVVDIQPLFEWMVSRGIFPWKGEMTSPRQYRLYDLAKNFDIAVNGGHNAMIDAFITAQVFQRFIPVLIKAGIRGTEELVKMSKNFRGGDRFIHSGGISNF